MTHFNFVISQNAKWRHAGFYIDCHRMTVPENILLQKKHWVAVSSLVNMTLFYALYRVVDRQTSRVGDLSPPFGVRTNRSVMFCSVL